MDLGYFAVSALGGDNFVGHADGSRIAPRSGMVRIRVVVGFHANDKSSPRRVAALFAWMACLSRFRRKPSALETGGLSDRRHHSVLRALDDPQLHRLSSIHSAAFKPAVRIVAPGAVQFS